jgi:nucleoside-diphosphate-sugar epimerase
MATKTAFLTGATGFLGRNLLDELLAQGWEVTALHRASSDLEGLRELPVHLAQGDLHQPESLVAALPERVDAVFHVAGNTSLWPPASQRQYRDNVEGTRHMVAAALARGARRFVHTSSFVVYDPSQGPVTEASPRTGADSSVSYYRTKALAEEEVRVAIERGLDAVILQPAHIVGPYDRDNWARVLRMVYQDKLPGVPPGAGSFADSRQVARAHVAAWERGGCGESYLLGGTDASFVELIRTAGKIVGRDVPSRPTPAFLLRLLGRLSLFASYFTRREPELTPDAVRLVVERHYCRSDKAERELGYRAVSLREMVEASYRWLREAGELE